MDKPTTTDFCDGCCYNNNPRPELNCKKVKCCYLVREDCILIDGVIMPNYEKKRNNYGG